MKRFLSHPLFVSIAIIAGLYVLFAHVLDPPLPQSLLIQYMVICVIGVLLVVTFDNNKAQIFAAPIVSLLGNPQLKLIRAAFIAVVSIGAAGLAYGFVKPDTGSPVELRTVHPAPPSRLRVYGKLYDLLKLKNPIREASPKGTRGYGEAVKQGGEIYYKNCIYCHGDLLAGRGQFAKAFNPRPANFQDVGTIAQLQESYLFWRITTGGPGLPREAAPWSSAMPVWHEMLKEDQVWKIITFLYDYTGHVPRSWQLDESKSGNKSKPDTAKPKVVKAGVVDDTEIDRVYRNRCAHCHGAEGDGKGPAADLMYPRPRDFTLATFKYKTTHADDEFPTDENLRKTIRDGLPGTAMPAWSSILTTAQIDGLIKKIKKFGEWDEEEIEHKPIKKGKPPEVTPKLLTQGQKLFVKACVQCHGKLGRGNITSGKQLKDDWGDRIWPRNLTRPETWRYTKTAAQVFERISTGIRGTPMPEHSTTMSVAARWAIANYVMTLRDRAVPLSKGVTVIKAMRLQSALPSSPTDPAWDKAPAITFALAPNIIKQPRLFFSLNDTVTVRALFNDKDIVIRVDIDDRTYSVPGDDLEKRYRLQKISPTRDAVAVQFPGKIPNTSEKPWFRHGDPKHPVNIWYWSAPSVTPQAKQRTAILDAEGPNKPPRARLDSASLAGDGVWADGQWRVVFKRALKTSNPADLQFSTGRYIPIAFANWDGLAGEKGARHTFTSWYWLTLEGEQSVSILYGVPATTGLVIGLLLLAAARGQRRKFNVQRG